MNGRHSANRPRRVVLGACALLCGAAGWWLTHSILNRVVSWFAGSHTLTHLSALTMAAAVMGAGSLAAILVFVSKSTASPHGLPSQNLTRLFGLLPPLGFVLAATVEHLGTGHHELPPILLLVLGASVQSVVGVATSVVWRLCVHTLRRLVKWRAHTGTPLPINTTTAEFAHGRVRPKLWTIIIPRRGPPIVVDC